MIWVKKITPEEEEALIKELKNTRLELKPGEAPAPSTYKLQGWTCPKCGRVNAPWVGTCPCYISKMEITY